MVCGRLSDANLCVSEAMKSNLRRLFQIDANVFYDRPPAWKFCEKTLEEIHNVYSALATEEKYKVLSPNGNPDETLITERVNGVVKYRADRPLLLFSSTSWTPDENFGILFDALVEYNALVELSDDRLPRLLVLITGKGPLKEHYLSQISEKQMRFVDVVSPWLAAEDYPTIVASADLGVSLHTSTSGLDLPMKVVDMFGARRPVLAKNFRCISELVKESENGNLFDSSDQLTQLLVDLAEGFPEESRLNKLKKNVLEMKFETWEEMWEKTAAPTLLLDQNQKETKKNN
ncbi:unnamed protein product [Caenorhabditis auriculariae]|uniref:Chitobiosyldiphosphodolichol beta-mannosyltransferase n=1 Tax=Caenorhabditis auriculariae TaxID=2777116 RepID=A0A8S1H4S0_9PELO|nr:unnamed protein product [Caenorhabditis auriculariae]